jgi:hypothetical protein
MFSEMLEISNTDGTSFATSSNVYKVYERDQNSDIFEDVIDGLILEKYADQDLKDYIKDLPSNKKRIATLLSIGDDNFLWSKINDIIKEEKSGYQRLKSVYTLLKDYVKIADVERKKHGEILTPFKELAEPMVKLVEKYDAEFWKNKNHKVLDSSAGYGTFLILAAYKFMVGLKDEFPDEEERFKWIVENCLYYGELQAKSVFSWLVAIDPHNEYKTNIYWGSFLSKEFDEHMKSVWMVEKFDLIIQNPPYQKRNDGDRKPFPLWDKFVFKSFGILKDTGYMVMVHPNGWRNIDGDFKYIQNILKNSILYINMNSVQEGEKIFGASTSFDYYIVSKSKNVGLTEINDFEDNIVHVDISNFEIIPNSEISLIYSLIASENEEKLEIKYSRSKYGTDKPHMSKNKTEIFKYPCAYSILKNSQVNLFFSNKKEEFFEPKVIFGNGANPTYFIDRDGEYGMTQFTFGIIGNIEIIEKSLLSKRSIIDRITKATKFISTNGNPILYPKILSIFRHDFFEKILEINDRP